MSLDSSVSSDKQSSSFKLPKLAQRKGTDKEQRVKELNELEEQLESIEVKDEDDFAKNKSRGFLNIGVDTLA